MFNVGGGELIVIAVIALIVLGPQRLPHAARQVGKAMADLRRLSTGFQNEVRNAIDVADDPTRTTTRRDVLATEEPASTTPEPAPTVPVSAKQGPPAGEARVAAKKAPAKVRKTPLKAAPVPQEEKTSGSAKASTNGTDVPAAKQPATNAKSTTSKPATPKGGKP